MRSEFGRQDFILIRAPIERVASALARELLEVDRRDSAEVADAHGLGKLMRRVVGGGAQQQAAPVSPPLLPPYSIHPDAPVAPITFAPPPAYSPDAEGFETPPDYRVSMVASRTDWTLVEFAEQISGSSATALRLSHQLSGADILYFRRSGDLAHEVHFDFHLYRDTETLRRVLCHSTWPKGEQEDEWWEAIAEGPISRYELPEFYADANERDLLTDDKIDLIIGGLRMSFDALFGPKARRCPLLFSRASGGTPILSI